MTLCKVNLEYFMALFRKGWEVFKNLLGILTVMIIIFTSISKVIEKVSFFELGYGSQPVERTVKMQPQQGFLRITILILNL